MDRQCFNRLDGGVSWQRQTSYRNDKRGWLRGKDRPSALAQVLHQLPKFTDEKLIVGFDTSDDALVYKVRDDLAVVQTVDFFPPIVDDPYTFGQIAAANSLSDIYAMGGDPSISMNLICFPTCLPMDVMAKIMQGGADKVKEAGAIIAAATPLRTLNLSMGCVLLVLCTRTK